MRTAAKVMGHWLRQSTARAFSQWQERTAEQAWKCERDRRIHETTRKSAQRWMKLRLASAYDAWLTRMDFKLQRGRFRSVAIVWLESRKLRVVLACAFGGWKDWSLTRKELEVDIAVKQCRHQRSSLVQVVVALKYLCRRKRIARDWCCAQAHRRHWNTRKSVFDMWLALDRWQLHIARLLTRWSNKRCARKLDAALLRWSAQVSVARTMRRYYGKVRSRSNASLCTEAMRGWHWYALLQRKTLLLWERAGARFGFRLWFGAVRGQQHLKSKYAALCLSTSRCRLALAIQSWKALVLDAFSSKHQSLSMDCFLRRWIKSKNCQALRTWRVRALTLRRLRAVSFKVIDRWTHRSQAEALSTWRQDLRQRRIMRKVSCRLIRLRLGRAFKTWASEFKAHQRTSLSMARILARWQRTRIAPAMTRWQECWAERRRLRRAAVKVVMRWQRTCIAPAMKRWQECWSERRRLRRAAVKVVMKWQQLNAAAAMSLWQAQLVDKKRLLVAAGRVMMRWRNIQLTAMWNVWQALRDERVLLIRNCDKAAAMCIRRRVDMVHAIMECWKMEWSSRKHRRRSACIGLGRALCQLLGCVPPDKQGALRRWQQAVARRKRASDAALHRAHRKNVQAVESVFEMWGWIVHEVWLRERQTKHEQVLSILAGSDIGKVYQDRVQLQAELRATTRERDILKTLVEQHEGKLAASRHKTAVTTQEHRRELRASQHDAQQKIDAERESKFLALKLTARNGVEEEPTQPSRVHAYNAPDKETDFWPGVSDAPNVALGLARAGLLLPTSLSPFQSQAPPTTPRLLGNDVKSVHSLAPATPSHTEDTSSPEVLSHFPSPPASVPREEDAAASLARHCGREKSAALARNLPSQALRDPSSGTNPLPQTDVLI